MKTSTDTPLPFTRVVALVTPDERGDPTIAWIAALLAAGAAELVVIQSAVNVSTERSPDDERAFLETRDAAAREWLQRHGLTATEIVSVDEADVSDEIIDRTSADDLVVIGLARPTDWSTAPDHVAAEIVHRLACPVVVVPAGHKISAAGPIVVGVDGTEHNYGVVQFAQQLATSTGRTLHAVHANNPMYDTFDNAGDYGEEEHRAHIEAEEQHVDFASRTGTVVDVLSEAAVSRRAFLTVVGYGHHRLTEHLGFLHPVRHLLHHPPAPIAVLPGAVADRYLRRAQQLQHPGTGVLLLTDAERATLGDVTTVLALTDSGTEPELRAERVAAARLAAQLDARLVLLDRSHQTWADSPHIDGPAGVDEVRDRGDDYLADQMLQMTCMGVPEVVAVTPSVPDFEAILDSIRLTNAEVIVVPDRLEHPHLLERWQHHGDVAIAIKEAFEDRHVIAVHDAATLRIA